jgi:hypothetical protein
MDKVQKPSNSECYTPSSEPFRIYMKYIQIIIQKFISCSHETYCISITKMNWLILPMEMIAVIVRIMWNINKFCGENDFYFHKFTVCKSWSFHSSGSEEFYLLGYTVRLQGIISHKTEIYNWFQIFPKHPFVLKLILGMTAAVAVLTPNICFEMLIPTQLVRQFPPLWNSKVLSHVQQSFSSMFSNASELCSDLLYYDQKSPLLVSVLGQMNLVSFLDCTFLRPTFILSPDVRRHLPGGLYAFWVKLYMY